MSPNDTTAVIRGFGEHGTDPDESSPRGSFQLCNCRRVCAFRRLSVRTNSMPMWSVSDDIVGVAFPRAFIREFVKSMGQVTVDGRFPWTGAHLPTLDVRLKVLRKGGKEVAGIRTLVAPYCAYLTLIIASSWSGFADLDLRDLHGCGNGNSEEISASQMRAPRLQARDIHSLNLERTRKSFFALGPPVVKRAEPSSRSGGFSGRRRTWQVVSVRGEKCRD
ncbi:hypothetical protein BCR34DRAFT_573486 [Clohesyomyces aquaticus]|uniref:Uncharacterized protein n=1 Tax=Clohesyomyces aquaticus TaxID=1231657 RepID=A0A1Y1YZT5_9PLEO|nr:hypothetical protein BCR34DRAFT_573486 [Clohesyomyces aquaticus]